jgi:hypothetical protein
VILTRIKKLPDDDHLLIETCRSAFKCFSVWHFKLMFYYIEVHLLAHYIQRIEIFTTWKCVTRVFSIVLLRIFNYKHTNICVKSNDPAVQVCRCVDGGCLCRGR